MGDGAALVHRYASARGRPVDLDAIAYHTVCLLALATIGPMIALVEEHPGGDFIEALSQIGFLGRRTLEAMAEIEDVVLDDIRLPPARVTPMEALATRKDRKNTRLNSSH